MINIPFDFWFLDRQFAVVGWRWNQKPFFFGFWTQNYSRILQKLLFTYITTHIVIIVHFLPS